MFEHQDYFAALNGKMPLVNKIEAVHVLLKQRFDFIDRIAFAVYDPETDLLKTFVNSSGGVNAMNFYSSRLADSVSLQEILKTGRPRLVNDLDIFSDVPTEHARHIAALNYKSSYTMPMFLEGEFLGFLFFNSYRANVFDETVLYSIDMAGHLLSSLVVHEIVTARSLKASVKTALNMVKRRDPETGNHLSRMSNYARLIAKEVAREHRLDDELVEHIFLFSPLHDIGKVSMPDCILIKPAKLTEEEFEVMKTHTLKGGEIIDMMLDTLELNDFPYAEILRNIALYHHEAINGSGYSGLAGVEIPIEAKIVAVADVFDALTSVRPYKEAWSNDEAFEFLQSMSGSKFDSNCVTALMNCREEVEMIQERFKEDQTG